jgi:integrase
LLTRRQALAVNGYVFPGKDDTGYLIDPKRQIAKVIEVSTVVFTLHDLRRTFATVAEGLDIAGYTLKRLLNHTIHGDVTAGYIVTDVERLRGPMERISRFLCSAMGMGEPSNVVPLARTSRPAEAIPREIGKNTR